MGKKGGIQVEHIVTAQEDGKKLRDILRRSMGVSYSAMKSAKWDNRILLDGIPATVDTPVRPGQTVTMVLAENAPVYSLQPYPLPLRIVYEDADFFIIDKPAPLASQSSAMHPDDSLENALFAHLGCPHKFIYRPVNRLDKGTSGLMAVARNPHAQHRLQQCLHTPDFVREYLAVVDDTPPEEMGVIDAPIAKENAASIRRVISPEGKPSRTHYQVLHTNGARALVRLRLDTGRTHQIRVHMAHLGCPVTGDFLYGRETPLLPGRFALHSAKIDMIHPLTGKHLMLESPLPEELVRLMEAPLQG
ncbi:MAG: RluA family pseudouridine synthase [Clostridiales bacterium]|nr:RluA family pseudouridine synthase [Clostridiales bacterium]